MKFIHVLNRVTGSPWFMTEAALENIALLLESRMAGTRFDAPQLEDGEAPDPITIRQAGPGIAIVPVNGALGKNLGLMEMMCGGVDYDTLTSIVASAAASEDVSQIILHISSPGGHAVGCGEAFARLNAIRESSGKPMLAFVDQQCCSAGYYLAAACDAIYSTEAAMVGCIGSMWKVEDRSGANAAAGIKRFAVTSARMKDMGNPDRSATPEEMTRLQQMVDFLGGTFKRDMQAARPQIAAEVFEKGISYFGAEGVSLGIVDELVANLPALISQISKTTLSPAI